MEVLAIMIYSLKKPINKEADIFTERSSLLLSKSLGITSNYLIVNKHKQGLLDFDRLSSPENRAGRKSFLSWYQQDSA